MLESKPDVADSKNALESVIKEICTMEEAYGNV